MVRICMAVWLSVIITLLPSCELIEATRNVKEASRDVKAATIQLQNAANSLEQATAKVADGIERWIVPALAGAGGIAATLFASKKRQRQPAGYL